MQTQPARRRHSLGLDLVPAFVAAVQNPLENVLILRTRGIQSKAVNKCDAVPHATRIAKHLRGIFLPSTRHKPLWYWRFQQVNAGAHDVVSPFTKGLQELRRKLSEKHLKIAPCGDSCKKMQNEARSQQQATAKPFLVVLLFNGAYAGIGKKAVDIRATEAEQLRRAQIGETNERRVKIRGWDLQRANGELC